uniref:RBR-type E3 ubiquitin transferase n=2 Tax=Aureoumbra lagunensis TaxID=44058 RepID=A0A7S3JT94_9STRA|mmetsp:Transcript_19384/g.23950  ORF Transcript_19384/g.23950 Transcript_19384/m.23950 type:complete len:911 (+) Transcript_19384:400-3132(+)
MKRHAYYSVRLFTHGCLALQKTIKTEQLYIWVYNEFLHLLHRVKDLSTWDYIVNLFHQQVSLLCNWSHRNDTTKKKVKTQEEDTRFPNLRCQTHKEINFKLDDCDKLKVARNEFSKIEARRAILQVLISLEKCMPDHDTQLLQDDKQNLLGHRIFVAYRYQQVVKMTYSTTASAAKIMMKHQLPFYFLNRPLPKNVMRIAIQEIEEDTDSLCTLFAQEERANDQGCTLQCSQALQDFLSRITKFDQLRKDRHYLERVEGSRMNPLTSALHLLDDNAIRTLENIRFDRDINTSLQLLQDVHYSLLYNLQDEAKTAVLIKQIIQEKLICASQFAAIIPGDRVLIDNHYGLVIKPVLTSNDLPPVADAQLENQNALWYIAMDDNSRNRRTRGNYDSKCGFWSIQRRHLRLVIDPEHSTQLSIPAIETYLNFLNDRTHAFKKAHNIQVITQGREKAHIFYAQQNDAFDWYSIDLNKCNEKRLERLARRVHIDLGEYYQKFNELKLERSYLNTACGGNDSRVDADNELSLTVLERQVKMLRREYNHRQAIFADYVHELKMHMATQSSFPSKHWLDTHLSKRFSNTYMQRDARLAGSALEAFIIDKVSDGQEEISNDDVFIFPFPELKENDYICLTDGAMRGVRHTFNWWLTCWCNIKDCIVCYEAHTPQDYIKPDNSFQYCDELKNTCRNCIADLARTALSDSSFLTEHGLPCFGCENTFTETMIRKEALLNAEECNKLRRFIRMRRIGDGVNKFWCPNVPSCDTVIDIPNAHWPLQTSTWIRCPTCGIAVCLKCRQRGHPFQDCQSGISSANVDFANSQGFQICPKCHVLVEKTHACDHLTCKCGERFCYKCGASGHGCRINCTKARRPIGEGLTVSKFAPSFESTREESDSMASSDNEENSSESISEQEYYDY